MNILTLQTSHNMINGTAFTKVSAIDLDNYDDKVIIELETEQHPHTAKLRAILLNTVETVEIPNHIVEAHFRRKYLHSCINNKIESFISKNGGKVVNLEVRALPRAELQTKTIENRG